MNLILASCEVKPNICKYLKMFPDLSHITKLRLIASNSRKFNRMFEILLSEFDFNVLEKNISTEFSSDFRRHINLFTRHVHMFSGKHLYLPKKKKVYFYHCHRSFVLSASPFKLPFPFLSRFYAFGRIFFPHSRV